MIDHRFPRVNHPVGHVIHSTTFRFRGACEPAREILDVHQRKLLSFGRHANSETARDKAERCKNVSIARPVYRRRADNQMLKT